MAVKLTVVYATPDDAEAFDRHYREVHTPIVQRYPGLDRVEIARVVGGPGGTPSPYYLIAEMYFADHDALNAALSSEAGRESGRDFRNLAASGTFMTVSEIVE
ncbi:MAG: EthD family reductase [Frankiaceae bacterium]|nr:EthD family reductase [Frankiaceae bacterium]